MGAVEPDSAHPHLLPAQCAAELSPQLQGDVPLCMAGGTWQPSARTTSEQSLPGHISLADHIVGLPCLEDSDSGRDRRRRCLGLSWPVPSIAHSHPAGVPFDP